jgi:nucleoside-diphosphate-sugar epimerase
VPADLRRARVLVLGASGFIGARLTERLASEYGAQVRVFVRAPMRAAVIARLPIEIVAGDVLDREAMIAAARGCSIIFNCVKGKGADPDTRRAVDVDAAGRVVDAARTNGARVVHVSTMAVYDRPADGEFDETSPPARRGDAYTDGKMAGERLALDKGRRDGVPVVVVQPSVVYGPGAGVYGTDIIQELTTGRVPLIDGGTGICNALYIDDLVSALVLAAVSDRAAGQRILISGDEYPTWREFFGAFERMIGAERTIAMSRAEAYALWRGARRRPWLLAELWRMVRDDRQLRRRLLSTREGRLLREFVGPAIPREWKSGARTSTNGGGRGTLTAGAQLPLVPLRPWVIDYMGLRARVRCTRARQLLGYAPAIDFATGMRRTELWARWAGLIPDGIDHERASHCPGEEPVPPSGV